MCIACKVYWKLQLRQNVVVQRLEYRLPLFFTIGSLRMVRYPNTYLFEFLISSFLKQTTPFFFFG